MITRTTRTLNPAGGPNARPETQLKSVRPNTIHSQKSVRARGIAYVIALMLLAIFSALSVVLATTADLNARKADNQRKIQGARLAAESGLSFLTYKLAHCGVSGSLRGQTLLNSLADKIGADLNGMPVLGGGAVTYDSVAVAIPSISFDGGNSFTGQITLPSADTVRLTVTGRSAAGAGSSATTVQRQVAMDFHPAWDQALGFGLCSKGPVELGMNTDLSGVSQPSDGSIYSAAPGIAIGCSSGHISGDVSTSDPNASMALGKTTVDGEVLPGVEPVKMPEFDRTPYKNISFTEINAANKDSFASVPLKNVYIKARTNPDFNTETIHGVMYVESPNIIHFYGNDVKFTGVMVADPPPATSTDPENYIWFKNNMTFYSVDQLSDASEFTEVKKLKGAAILCPGFKMEVKNNMNSVAGVMALKTLVAMNNLDSTVFGSILIYGDAGLDFKNNSDLNISLSGSSPPPGFDGYGKAALEPDPDTYAER